VKLLFEKSAFYIFLALVGMSLLSFFWTPFTQEWIELSSEYALPSTLHWFGQGENGIDVFSHVMIGLKNSFVLSISVNFLSATIGAGIGIGSVLLGKFWDEVLSRLVDVFNAFPSLIIFMCVMAFWGNGFLHLFFALSVTGWASYARVLRSLALSTTKEPFVEAAVASGASSFRVLFAHILPQLYPVFFVQIFLGLRRVIFAEAALSFLGLGQSPETASLGRLIAQGKEALLVAPHLLFIPGVILFLLMFCILVLGDKVQRLWVGA